MTTLAEELEYETKAAFRRKCIMCGFLAELDVKAANEWRAQLSRPAAFVSHAAVARVLAERGVTLTDDAVRNHREKHQ